MTKRKLHYRFHNPNSAEETARYLEKLFVEVNTCKVRTAIETASYQKQEQSEDAMTCV